MDNDRSYRPTTASSPKNKAHVEAAILGNSRMTVSELEHDLGFSHGTNSQDYSGVSLPQGLCAMGSANTVGRPKGAKNG
jgi:hypothetical protein